MAEERARTPEEVGHEPTTVGARAVLFGLACVVAAMLVAMLMIAGLMAHFAEPEIPAPVVGTGTPPIEPPPSVPMLEPRQAGFLQSLRAREAQLLSEYAWVDQEEDIARIPVARAMELLAARAAEASAAEEKPRE